MASHPQVTVEASGPAIASVAPKSTTGGTIARHSGRIFGRVFFPFAAGYFLSYLFRTINALVAPELTKEVGLTAAELGLLTSAYFATFAAAQVPLGVLLDRYGPRRVQSCLLLLAAVGSLSFAFGRSPTALMIARGLIGFGVSGALMGGLKALVQFYPKERLGLANGCFILFGGLGALASAAPSQALLEYTTWRGLFLALAIITLCLSLLILLVPPRSHDERSGSGLREVIVGLKRVYGDPFFWTVAPASGCAIGNAWAVQGLWAGQWLADVNRVPRADVVQHLTAMAMAFCIASVVIGVGVDALKRRGIRPITTAAAAFSLFALLQAAVVFDAPVETRLLWSGYGAFAAGTVFSYTLLGQHFPKEFSARANTALNLLHMTMAFAFQFLIGAVLVLWPMDGGHYQADAYRTAFGLILVLQVCSAGWMIWRANTRHVSNGLAPRGS